MAQSVAIGCSFLGEFPTIKGNVLFLDFEDDQEEFTRRSYEIARGLEMERPTPGLFYRRVNRPLGDIEYEVSDYVGANDISLSIIDSFGAASAGDTEGSGDSIALMQILQRLPCTILLIDHEPKGRDGRGPTQYGSVYKRNLSRSQLRLEDRDWPQPGRHALLLKHTKLNSGPLHGGFPFYLCFEAGSVYAVKADPSDPVFQEDRPVEELIVEALGAMEKGTKDTIAEKIDREPRTVGNRLTSMSKNGRVEIVGKDGKASIYRLRPGEGALEDSEPPHLLLHHTP